MDYCFKISGLNPWQMGGLQKSLDFFVRRGVKCTYRKRVAYIHLDNDKQYSVIGNLLCYYKKNLTASEKALRWLKRWHPVF